MRIHAFLLLFAFTGCQSRPRSNAPIAIQPLGDADTAGIAVLRAALQEEFSRPVVLLASTPLPSSAINRSKGLRYSADSLLRYLRAQQPDSVACTLGLTDADIFVTKRDAWGRVRKPESRYAVFGIFGLAERPGRVCVVSRHRLRRGGVTAVLRERVRRVAIHEIGHNLGRRHCPDTSCVMTSALEKLSTIDQTSGRFCARCAAAVRQQ